MKLVILYCVCLERGRGVGVKYAQSTFFSGPLCLLYSNSLCNAVYCGYRCAAFMHYLSGPNTLL